MDEDLIKLGAYVVFFVIIAGASIFRKLREVQKKRQEEELRRGRLMRGQTTLHPQTPTKAPADQTAMDQSPAPKPEVPIDLEDIFRKAFGIPEEPAKTRPVKIMPRRPEPVIVESKPVARPTRPATTTETADEPRIIRKTAPEKEAVFSWQGFMDTLDERGLTGIQKAIILTEVFNKPPALRRFRK